MAQYCNILASSLIVVLLIVINFEQCQARSPACKACATIPISKSELSQPFTSDSTNTSGACATRTFVCTAPDSTAETNIGINGESTLAKGQGSITATITCNDQAKWIGEGATVVTSVECQYIK